MMRTLAELVRGKRAEILAIAAQHGARNVRILARWRTAMPMSRVMLTFW